VQGSSLGARVPVVETVHEILLLQEGHGVEEGVALLGFSSALREESLLVLQRRPVFTPGLPHVRLIDIEGGIVRVRETDVLEVALERPAVGHLLPAGDPWLPYPRQHEPFGRGVLGHTCSQDSARVTRVSSLCCRA
jgi:hypothetical protein